MILRKKDKTYTSDSMVRILLPSILGAVLCSFMLVGTSWAWFSDGVSSGPQTIQSANFGADVTVACLTDTDEVVVSDAGVYSLKAGEAYSVSFETSGTASKGFCTMTYHEADVSTENVEKMSTSVMESGDVLSFTFIPQEDTECLFNASWGEPQNMTRSVSNTIEDNGSYGGVVCEVASAEALKTALDEANTDGITIIKITDNIEASLAEGSENNFIYDIKEDTDVVIKMADEKTFKATLASVEEGVSRSVFKVSEGAKLTIDSGLYTATTGAEDNDIFDLITNEGGNVFINGGTFTFDKAMVIIRNIVGSDTATADNNSSVTINGGTFKPAAEELTDVEAFIIYTDNEEEITVSDDAVLTNVSIVSSIPSQTENDSEEE